MRFTEPSKRRRYHGLKSQENSLCNQVRVSASGYLNRRRQYAADNANFLASKDYLQSEPDIILGFRSLRDETDIAADGLTQSVPKRDKWPPPASWLPFVLRTGR